MSAFTLENPVFRIYVIAAALVIFKMLGQAYITVYRMMSVKGGFASPEDARKTPLNPNPAPGQLAPNEDVERSRRMHRNDCENIPLFLAAGLIFVAAGPSPALAAWLMYGYVASRAAHFLAYFTAQIHDIRATFWTIGTLILIAMTGYALHAALGQA
jgi:glutathione S-transferase